MRGRYVQTEVRPLGLGRHLVIFLSWEMAAEEDGFLRLGNTFSKLLN